MSDGVTPQRRLDDRELEALLAGFFEREMPAELRRAAISLRPAAQQRPPSASFAAAPPAAGRGTLTIVLVAAALLLVVALALTGPGAPEPRVASTKEIPGVEEGAATTAVASVNALEEAPVDAPQPAFGSGLELLPFAIADDRVESRERMQYDTSEGPVEQRMERRIRNVSIYDPETGSKLEVTIPEVTIEIYPIEDQR